ncbi:MAG: sulfatase [Planctomycetota bacterium]|jgi:arylsulfatase
MGAQQRRAAGPAAGRVRLAAAAAAIALAGACDAPSGGGVEAPAVLRLADAYQPALTPLRRELTPAPGHRVELVRADGDASVQVRETWRAEALGATPLPGVWSALPSLTLSLSARGLPRVVRVDGEPFDPVDADLAARALQSGAELSAGNYAELEGELLVLCGGDAPPGEVELRYSLPLGSFATGRWRVDFPTFAGDGWLLLPDAAGACGAFEAPVRRGGSAAAGTSGHLLLRVLDLDRRGARSAPGHLELRADSGAESRFELPAFDAEAPWLEVAWPLEAGWTRVEFGLADSLAAAVLDARWVPGSAAPSDTGTGPPDVLVFLADTFRADLLRAYRGAPAGDDLDVAPRLDAWAARHTLFRRSWSVSTWTLPAQASLLSGSSPIALGATAPDRALDDDAPFLAQRFAEGGYRCTAITDGLFVAPKYGLAAGFEWFDARAHEGEVDERVAAAWDPRDPRPRFSYVQTYRAHSPYFASASAREAFDGVLQPAVDDASGRSELSSLGAELETGGRPLDLDDPALVASMERLRHLYLAGARDLDRMFEDVRERFVAGAADPARVVVVFTSDHGEAFGEHGVMDHGREVYEHQLRVPLIIEAPGWPAAVREDPVSTLDLAPTLALLAGLDPDPRWVGRDLGVSAAAPRVLWSWQANGFRRHQSRARVLGDLKVVRLAPEDAPVVFDLEHDPLELAPLGSADARAAAALESFLEEETQKITVRPGAGRSLELSGDERRALEAMGYVTGAEER